MTTRPNKNSNNLARKDIEREVPFPDDVQVILRGDSLEKGNLFIGNIEAANNVQLLQKLHVKAIVTAAKGRLPKHPKDIIPQTKYVPLSDDDNCQIYDFLNETATFIADKLQNTNVLVHCVAGVSRSAALVIAYFMKERGLTLEEAYCQVKARRRVICPSANILDQLNQYEKELSLKRAKKHIRTPYKSLKRHTESKSLASNIRSSSGINIEVLAPKNKLLVNPEQNSPEKKCRNFKRENSLASSNINHSFMRQNTDIEASLSNTKKSTQRRQSQIYQQDLHVESTKVSRISQTRKQFTRKMQKMSTLNKKINSRLDLIQDNYNAEVRLHKNNLQHEISQIYKAKADLYAQYKRQKQQKRMILHEQTMQDQPVRQYIKSTLADRS